MFFSLIFKMVPDCLISGCLHLTFTEPQHPPPQPPHHWSLGWWLPVGLALWGQPETKHTIFFLAVKKKKIHQLPPTAWFISVCLSFRPPATQQRSQRRLPAPIYTARPAFSKAHPREERAGVFWALFRDPSCRTLRVRLVARALISIHPINQSIQ